MVELTKTGIRVNGKSEVLLCASLFYFRIPRARWLKRIQDLKSIGYNCADVYFPWNFHEISAGKFDFGKDKDVREFLRLCAENGLYVIARPGPYICSEWDGGGLPSRICSFMNIRQYDEAYLAEVAEWYRAIMPVLAEYEVGRGGSVVLVQLENELDFYECREVEKMIGRLRDLARECGVTVPLFCCSGQSDTKNAGGLTEGVYPTFNFYPSDASRDFDGLCAYYGGQMKARGLPLLVSETNRNHSMLKRELLAGAKLLGAYNQVAGSNFEYFQSVNNWGNPLSVITTRYDFDSMITTLGDFGREAPEGIAFAGMLSALGESLAESERADFPIDFRETYTSPFSHNALRLSRGGYLLGFVNVGQTDGYAEFQAAGKLRRITVAAGDAMAIPYGVEMADLTIDFSDGEIFSFDGKTLTFAGGNTAVVTVGGKTCEIEGKGSVGGVFVRFLSRKKAAEEYCEARGIRLAFACEHEFCPVSDAKAGDMQETGKFKPAKSLLLCDLGIWYGGIEAEVHSIPEKPLLLWGVSDFLTVETKSGAFGKLYGGESVLLPPEEDGIYHLRAEKWGHSNFEDSRTKNLYIGSKRGIGGVYGVEAQTPLTHWQFLNYYEWMPETLCYERDPLLPVSDVNCRNSSRLPLIGLYYTEISPISSDKLCMRIEGGTAEVCVYVNGKFRAYLHPSDKIFDLTEFNAGGKFVLELLVRKRNWTEPVGSVSLLALRRAEISYRPFGREEMLAAAAQETKAVKFPFSFRAGEKKVLTVDLGTFADRDCYGVVKGKGYKLTAVYGEKVIARMLAPDAEINQQGGSETQFLIPSCYGNGKLKFVLEALKDGFLEFGIEYNPKMQNS